MSKLQAVFDGVRPARNRAVSLRLKSVEQRGGDALWIRYEVVWSETADRTEAGSLNCL